MDFREFATKETASLVDRLIAAAAAQAADARTAADEEAQKIIAPLRADLKERAGQIAALEASIKTLESKAADLQTRAEKAEATAKSEAVARRDAEKEKTASDTRKATAEAEAKSARAAADKAVAEKADAVRRLTALEQTHAETDRVRRQLEIKMAAAANTEKTLRTQPLDRLLATFQQLAKATTSAGVLTALVNGLGSEFARVALFSVSSNRLEGMHQLGFEFKSDISKVVMPFANESDSLLMQAVTSGRVQGHTGAELTEGSCAPFGGSPAFVLTVPILVRGKTVGVVYADTGDKPAAEIVPERAVKFAELLLWHAVPMLSRLSAELESASEVRNYATLLLDEIAEMYANDAAGEVTGPDLASRLKENVECARRLFSQRIESEGAWATAFAPLLDEQVDAAIAKHAGTPYGRDLVALIKPPAAKAEGHAKARKSG